MAVVILVVNQRRDRLKHIRVAVGPVSLAMLSAPDVVEVPLDVSQHHQVQKTVVVQIHPRRAGGPAAPSDTGLLRDVGEGAIAIVVVELIAPISGHIQIFEAVIVIIADRHTHPVSRALQAGLFRYVLKSAVSLLVVQPVPVGRSALLRDGPFGCGIAERRAVHEKNIQPPIVVVVEQRDPCTHGFDQIVFRNMRGQVSEVDPQCRGRVDKFPTGGDRLGGHLALLRRSPQAANCNHQTEKNTHDWNIMQFSTLQDQSRMKTSGSTGSDTEIQSGPTKSQAICRFSALFPVGS